MSSRSTIFFEVRKQNALNTLKNLRLRLSLTMTVFMLTEGSGPTEAGISVLDDIDLHEQWATTSQGIMRMLACCEEILKEKRSWSSETSVLHFFKSSESRLSPPVLFDTGGDETDDPPTV
jgi:hypothetical protein